MASLPSDRTKLALAQSNENPGIAAGSAVLKNTLTEAYDTIDLLNQKVDSLVGASTLSPYPPAQYNRLINGGFAVNQRVVSGTVTLAAGAYGHDRWKAGAAGCTYTFSTTNNVTTITITAGSLIQVIEGISLYSGTHTLSWTGTSQGKIGAGAFGVSGITSSVVGGTNLSIEFNVGTISNVQFNFGSISLPFQPRNYGEELALCKRYCQVFFPQLGQSTFANGMNTSTTRSDCNFLYSEMRVSPTFTFSTPTDFSIFTAGVVLIAATAITASIITKVNCDIVVTVASGLTQGQACQLFGVTVNAKITLDAEL